MRIKVQTEDGKFKFWFVIEQSNRKHVEIQSLIDSICEIHQLNYYNTIAILQDFPIPNTAETFKILKEDDLLM